MIASIRSNALAWADAVVEGTFFLMQIYLTDVWKLSFTGAAAFLNIWGGIYRILPIFIVFLTCNSKSRLLNYAMLGFSGIFSTTGLVLITYTAWPGYRCHKKGEAECVGRREKAVFITGMALIALAKAARFAASQQFIVDQTDHDDHEGQASVCCNGPSCGLLSQICVFLRSILVILFFATPAVVFFVFPYVKEWYIPFGVSAICMALATVAHLSRFRKHQKPGPNQNPASVIKHSFTYAIQKLMDVTVGRNAAHGGSSPKVDSDEKSDDKVDDVARMIIMYSTGILCGVVSSIGNTYFVEQATHMNYNIGGWKPPLQLLQLIFLLFKHYCAIIAFAQLSSDNESDLEAISFSAVFSSVPCCAVAAAVERRRVHAVRRHDLVDDAKTPMSAFWLLFQVSFLGIVEGFSGYGLSKYHEKQAPEWMKRYGHCLSEAVSGLGYMCGVLSVYVVGEISEKGDGKNWFQHTLNRSRLDRYYWVLTALCAVYFFVNIVLTCVTAKTQSDDSEEE